MDDEEQCRRIVFHDGCFDLITCSNEVNVSTGYCASTTIPHSMKLTIIGAFKIAA